jgi:hypothetical protein
MGRELKILIANETWDLVPRPHGVVPLPNKWVFKTKIDPENGMVLAKSRLTVCGNMASPGVDYEPSSIFSPVVSYNSLRILFALAMAYGLLLFACDIRAAFVHASIDKPVYMRQPRGWESDRFPYYVCLLRKSLYGLRQAPRLFTKELTAHLVAMGFVGACDPCVFVLKSSDHGIMFVAFFVDDGAIACKGVPAWNWFIASLRRKFDVEDKGRLHTIVGMRVCVTSGGLHLSQPLFTEELVRKQGLQNGNPVKVPGKFKEDASSIALPLVLASSSKYRELGGSLLWLANLTRPDISHAVRFLSRYCSNPTQHHSRFAKNVVRYLAGTLTHGLLYPRTGGSLFVRME